MGHALEKVRFSVSPSRYAVKLAKQSTESVRRFPTWIPFLLSDECQVVFILFFEKPLCH